MIENNMSWNDVSGILIVFGFLLFLSLKLIYDRYKENKLKKQMLVEK